MLVSNFSWFQTSVCWLLWFCSSFWFACIYLYIVLLLAIWCCLVALVLDVGSSVCKVKWWIQFCGVNVCWFFIWCLVTYWDNYVFDDVSCSNVHFFFTGKISFINNTTIDNNLSVREAHKYCPVHHYIVCIPSAKTN